MNKILFPLVNEPLSQEALEYRAMRRELALIDERTALEAAWKQGYEEGLAEAREELKKRGMAFALSRVIANGIPEAEARAMLPALFVL